MGLLINILALFAHHVYICVYKSVQFLQNQLNNCRDPLFVIFKVMFQEFTTVLYH